MADAKLDDIFVQIITDQYVDPRPLYDEIRTTAPVYKTPFGIWWVTKHDLAQSVLNNKATWTVDPRFSTSGAIRHPESFTMQTWTRNLVVNDGETHQRLHSLVKDLFKPTAIKALHETVTATVKAQLDELGDREDIEFCSEFAEVLPTRVVLDLLGIDMKHLHVFTEVPDSLAQMMEPDVTQETLTWGDAIWREAADVVVATATERRLSPRDDLMTSLVQATAEGGRMTEDELVSMVLVIVVAGQETTGSLMCSGLYHMLSTGQLDLLRNDRSLMSKAIEESLRYDTATRVSGPRYAFKDTELGGTTVPAGDAVMVCLQAANHDPAVFDDANRFDIRRNPGRHVGFGFGPHHCLGSALARMELEIVWNAILDRYSSIEAPTNLAWRPRYMTRALQTLPLRVQLASADKDELIHR